MKPAAVIFDCDGVLVDSEILALEIELEMLAPLGLTYDLPEYRRRFLGMHDSTFRDALDADHRALHGEGLPPSFVEEVHERRRVAVEQRLTEVPGAKRAALTLTLPKAVASSTGISFLELKLRKADLWDVFAPHAYSAELVARGKPAPDIFLHAANAIRIDPRDCLAIEDSVNGIVSARAANMRAWGFTGGRHCGEETADMLREAGAEDVIETWAQAEALFAHWR